MHSFDSYQTIAAAGCRCRHSAELRVGAHRRTSPGRTWWDGRPAPTRIGTHQRRDGWSLQRRHRSSAARHGTQWVVVQMPLFLKANTHRADGLTFAAGIDGRLVFGPRSRLRHRPRSQRRSRAERLLSVRAAGSVVATVTRGRPYSLLRNSRFDGNSFHRRGRKREGTRQVGGQGGRTAGHAPPCTASIGGCRWQIPMACASSRTSPSTSHLFPQVPPRHFLTNPSEAIEERV